MNRRLTHCVFTITLSQRRRDARWFHNADGLRSKGSAPDGFEIAGHDGVFVPASAHIDGETVTVESQAVPNPEYVRYAWPNFPKANLYNGAGLPASTFTSFQPPSSR